MAWIFNEERHDKKTGLNYPGPKPEKSEQARSQERQKNWQEPDWSQPPHPFTFLSMEAWPLLRATDFRLTELRLSGPADLKAGFRRYRW